MDEGEQLDGAIRFDLDRFVLQCVIRTVDCGNRDDIVAVIVLMVNGNDISVRVLGNEGTLRNIPVLKRNRDDMRCVVERKRLFTALDIPIIVNGYR